MAMADAVGVDWLAVLRQVAGGGGWFERTAPAMRSDPAIVAEAMQ